MEIDFCNEVIPFLIGLAASFFYSLTFIPRYLNVRSGLFLWNSKENLWILEEQIQEFGWEADAFQIVKETDEMFCVLWPFSSLATFEEILGNCLGGYLILMIGMIFLGIYHYALHYRGSKSIYLMRRLPDQKELHRRCLTFPVAGILISLLLFLCLLAGYYCIYRFCTPSIFFDQERLKWMTQTACELRRISI